MKRFEGYCWSVVGYLVLVILWGAYVRATGSGAGCGDHWPLCNGEVIPRDVSTQTAIEYTHRVSSGLSLLAVLGMWIWARKQFTRGSWVRRAAFWTFILILIEAALGAGLVLLELVAEDKSLTRTVSVALHLVNTLFLLAAATATAVWAKDGDAARFHLDRKTGYGALTLLAGFAVLGATGAITALGDTLFPATRVGGGSTTEHFLVSLRIVHPVFAALYGILAMVWIYRARVPTYSTLTLILIITNVLVGIVNVGLLAPVKIQMLHLLVADAIWISMIALVLRLGSGSAISKAV